MLELQSTLQCNVHPFYLSNYYYCNPLYTLISATSIVHAFDCNGEVRKVKQIGIMTKNEEVPLAFALVPPRENIECKSTLCKIMQVRSLPCLPYYAPKETFYAVQKRLNKTTELTNVRVSIWGAAFHILRQKMLNVNSPFVETFPTLYAKGPNSTYVNAIKEGIKYVKRGARIITDKEAYKLIRAGIVYLIFNESKYLTWTATGTKIKNNVNLWFETERINAGIKIIWTKPKEEVKRIGKVDEFPLWFLASLLGLRKLPQRVENEEDMLYYSLTRRNSLASKIEIKENVLVSGVIKVNDKEIASVFNRTIVGNARFLSILDYKRIVGPHEPRKVKIVKTCNSEEEELEVREDEELYVECAKDGKLKIKIDGEDDVILSFVDVLEVTLNLLNNVR